MVELASVQEAVEVPAKPHMSDPEIALFSRALGGCQRYLEFGAGGSTCYALSAGVERIVSVESDIGWVEALRQMPAIAEASRANRLHLLHGDIGPVRKWGFPRDDSAKAQWRQYPEAPWPVWQRLGASPQLVLVDGRFRVACALRAALWFLEHDGRAGVRLLCHDFSPKRSSYQTIFQYFDLVEVVDTLVYARLKVDLRQKDIEQAYKRAVFQTI